MHIILYQPEIPPNTGNIIRLCANTGAQLHLIQPLGFHWDDKLLLRAGLDYHEWANIKHHVNYQTCLAEENFHRVYACSTKGQRCYTDASFQKNDALLFGPESRGLPDEVLATFQKDAILHIPMRETSRSLNLSNAVAVIVYEAYRQLGFW